MEFFGYEEENLLLNCVKTFEEFRKSGKFCDFSIKAKDQIIVAHRLVLSATVPYFCRFFSSEETQKSEVEIIDVDPNAIESLINFCYTGKIRIETSSLVDLMILVKLFELSSIWDACVEFACSNLSPKNVIKLKKLAQKSNCEELIASTGNFICENFSEIVLTEDFMELNFQEFLEIIDNDDLNVTSKEEIYQASIDWVKHGESERDDKLPEILSKLHLFLMSSDYLVNVISKENLIRKSIECRDILDEAKNYQLISKTRELSLISGVKTPVEPVFDEKMYLICGSYVCENYNMRYSVYHFNLHEWTIVAKLQIKKSPFQVTVLNGKLFVIGGMLGGVCTSSVQILDLKTLEWVEEGKKMLTDRCSFGVATLNDRIYACGGTGSDYKSLKSVESFCDFQKEWTQVASLNMDRVECGAVALNGYVYIIGGYSNWEAQGTCERYCPMGNKWTIIQSMGTERYALKAAPLDGKLYACGGYNLKDGCLNTCEVYDPETDTWSFIAPMNDKRSHFALTSCNGKLYAMGGSNGNWLSTVEEYCPIKNEWRFVTPLPDKAYDIKAVTVTMLNT